MKFDASQIEKFLAGYVRASALSANGGSTVVTSALTTVLGTAGDAGVAVPLQEATTTLMGVITTGGNNRVEIYLSSTKQKITKDGGEVYGRITYAGGAYTLTYYYLNAGSETAYSFAGATNIDFEFIYKFAFDYAPYDIIVGSKARNVNEEGASIGRVFTEKLNVSALNTFTDVGGGANLAFTPDQNYNVALIVNGKHESTQDAPVPFTVSGKTITWSAANAGYPVKTTFSVIAKYTTLQ